MEFCKGVALGMDKPLEPPLFNGGGCVKTVEDVKKVSRSLSGAVVVGSFTKEERSGNYGNVWWVSDMGCLNSLGMPNGGVPYLKKNLKEMVTIAHDAGKPLIMNVAGFSHEEYAELAEISLEEEADAVELNLGCPNVVQGDGSRKPIPSYDLVIFEQILYTVQSKIGSSAVVLVKVSPNPINDMIKKMAKIVAKYSCVRAITTINTFPNSYAVDEAGKPRISVGLAGLSGPPLKYLGLGQVMQWCEALPKHIEVIAVGGICSGRDVRDYEVVGASAFQMTTELLKSGDLNPRCFDRVAIEYTELEA